MHYSPSAAAAAAAAMMMISFKALSCTLIVSTLVLFLAHAQESSSGEDYNDQVVWTGSVMQNISGFTAEQVWPFFEDYCNMFKVFPLDVSFCVGPVEEAGGAVKLRVQRRRYMAIKMESTPSSSDGSGGNNETYIYWELQNLLAIDPVKHFLTTQFLDNSINTEMFRMTMRVLPKDDGCQIRWDYALSPAVGYTTPETLRSLLDGRFQKTAANIKNILSSSSK